MRELLWLLQKGYICLFIKSYQKALKRKYPTQKTVSCALIPFHAYRNSIAPILRENDARIFVYGHYLFLEAQCFPHHRFTVIRSLNFAPKRL